MNMAGIPLRIALVVGLVVGCETRDCGCAFPESPLAGNWQLARITYGLTQKTVTAAEAGYSETLTFTGNVEQGTYQQKRNGIPVESGKYSLAFPNGGSTEGRILYQVPNQAETLEQSFTLQENRRLILSERKPVNVALADGSTYEYIRQ